MVECGRGINMLPPSQGEIKKWPEKREIWFILNKLSIKLKSLSDQEWEWIKEQFRCGSVRTHNQIDVFTHWLVTYPLLIFIWNYKNYLCQVSVCRNFDPICKYSNCFEMPRESASTSCFLCLPRNALMADILNEDLSHATFACLLAYFQPTLKTHIVVIKSSQKSFLTGNVLLVPSIRHHNLINSSVSNSNNNGACIIVNPSHAGT